MYTTIIFDLDGTLLNTLDDLADAGNRLCAALSWPTHPVQGYRYLVGNGIPKLIERLAPPEQRSPAVLADALARFEADYGAPPARQDRAVPRRAGNARALPGGRCAAGRVFQQGRRACAADRHRLFRSRPVCAHPRPAPRRAGQARARRHPRRAGGPGGGPGPHALCGRQQRRCADRPQRRAALLRRAVGLPHAGGTAGRRRAVSRRRRRRTRADHPARAGSGRPGRYSPMLQAGRAGRGRSAFWPNRRPAAAKRETDNRGGKP